MSKHEEEGDIKVKFMHPFGPAPSFHWPSREDICYVPLNNVIAKISTPATKGSGRVYYFLKRNTICATGVFTCFQEAPSFRLTCKKLLYAI